MTGKKRCGLTLAIAAAVYVPHPSSAQVQQLDFDDPAWELAGDGTRVEMFQGRKALRIGTGQALRRDIEFGDGTIEFDVSMTPHRTFVYLKFRMTADDQYEDLYLRTHKSELPDAIQYSPVFQGRSEWQLYHGPGGTAAAPFPPGEWVHVRVVLQGARAAVFVGDVQEPQLLVPQLAHGTSSGYVGLRGFIAAGSNAEYAAYYSNLVLRPGEVDYLFSEAPSAADRPVGIIDRWRVSPAFQGDVGVPERVPSNSSAESGWPKLAANPDGMVELQRHVQIPPDMRPWSVVARVTIRSSSDQVKRLNLGFSDQATVLLNGIPLYFGDHGYRFDEPRRQGLFGLGQATVFLPLEAGFNTLTVVVSDTFGGWAIGGQIEDRSGIEILP